MATKTPKFKVGEKVHYNNGYGLYVGIKTVVEIEEWQTGFRYYIEPTDAPWYSVAERQLRKVKDETK